VDDAIAALDGGLAVESPSGACSSIQKLKSVLLQAMAASCLLEVAACSEDLAKNNPRDGIG